MSKNNSALSSSSRSLPLKLSMYPFSIGRPGRMKSSFTWRWWAQASITFEYVEELPRTASGKLRLAVSEIPEAHIDAS
jgi:hypothetical protein